MSSAYYNVKPRYTPGSPALVGRHIAERVAVQEREHYEFELEGRCGPRLQERARREGLGGIVELVVERGGKIERRDLITGEVTVQKTKARRRS